MLVLPTLSDQEILSLIGKDDRAAFGELYSRYWRSLYQTAWNVLRDQESCMEVIQEVFVWLWDHRSGLQINSLPSYLKAAVKYKVTDILRSNKVREACFVNLDELDAANLLFDDDPLELKELKTVIAQMSAKLPARARLIFELSRNEQLSNREIATKLGISEKTVENQITIALKKLRVALGSVSIWLFFL
ncbi:RNA polymerase sigma-70 factor [Mucilaginibacter sp. X5P1]|uniref:RNA polymerase sigma-70 factor n=1 Tax=Mucilaginibacter sp. X5P1 TaxID=2723088 RepID=UPI0016226966|nr:RNA polymerase sigma-70 factor [Mucilaginibacter sp. X5P1]MBB6137566.1 RNA polymerase sigma-70 factor (ECF subfamily) [Mucilaginibacter sp. X5P1]